MNNIDEMIEFLEVNRLNKISDKLRYLQAKVEAAEEFIAAYDHSKASVRIAGWESDLRRKREAYEKAGI